MSRLKLLPSRGPGWTPYWKMVVDMPYEAYLGVYYGFPLCCIAHYCLDNLLYRLSAQERGMAFKRRLNRANDDGLYVPCAACKGLLARARTWRPFVSLPSTPGR